VRYRCRRDGCRAPQTLDLEAGVREPTCERCGATFALQTDDGVAAAEPLQRCVICGGREFFLRRDFPQRLGLALVVLCALVASVFYYLENIPATFGTLAALVIVDAIICLFVGKVVVCYRCRAEYRGLAYNPRHDPFDLATAEKYQ